MIHLFIRHDRQWASILNFCAKNLGRHFILRGKHDGPETPPVDALTHECNSGSSSWFQNLYMQRVDVSTHV